MGSKPLLAVLLLATFGAPAHARLIPYYRMDSLSFMSSDIVLCDEVSWVKKSRGVNREYHEGTFTVIQVLKGNCQPKDQLVVDLYGRDRHTIESWGKPLEERPTMPMGRALLFLNKKKEAWQLVDVKLIIDGETYTYGQFIMNPGGLWLARMAPENFDVLPITPYAEKLLLQDLQIAQENAKNLTAAIPGHATHDLIRTEFVPYRFLRSAAAAGAAVALSVVVIWWQLARRRRAHQRYA